MTTGSYIVEALRARFADESMPWSRAFIKSLIDQIDILTQQRDELSAARPTHETLPVVPKEYETAHPALSELLDLTGLMHEGKANMDIGIMWMDALSRVEAMLSKATPQKALEGRTITRCPSCLSNTHLFGGELVHALDCPSLGKSEQHKK